MSATMDLTVRPAKPADYDEIDRLTYSGYITAQRAASPTAVPNGGSVDSASSAYSRSSSYLCTVKGSANMRANDALTFVCVKHVPKQSFLKSLFGRVRGGSESNLFTSANPQVKAGLKALASEGELLALDQRRSSTPYSPTQGFEALNERRRASAGMRRPHRDSTVLLTLDQSPLQNDLAEDCRYVSPAVSTDSQSTATTAEPPDPNGSKRERDHSWRRKHRKNLPNSDALELMKDRSICLLAAEATPQALDEYRACGTLTGHEEEFSIGTGIRTRVKRQEGPEGKLYNREEAVHLHELDGVSYDPSRGVSVYKKPIGIDLEASVTPEGYLVARPSPAADASDLFASSGELIKPLNQISERPMESPFRFFRKRLGSNDSAKCSDGCAEEKIVGSVTYAPYESGWGIVSDVNDVELRMLSITPVKGVAGILIDHCVQIAEKEKRSAVHVLVNSTNKAAHLLYVRHGFNRNPDKDRFDAHANTSLKCFSIDLGHPRPAAPPPGLLVGDLSHPQLLLGGAPQLIGNSAATEESDTRHRAGMFFSLRSLHRHRATVYQKLPHGNSLAKTAAAK